MIVWILRVGETVLCGRATIARPNDSHIKKLPELLEWSAKLIRVYVSSVKHKVHEGCELSELDEIRETKDLEVFVALMNLVTTFMTYLGV
jgi:hypothetical protein